MSTSSSSTPAPSGGPENTGSAGSAGSPNILLIMADELIAALTGAYGHPVVQTPNLDALVRRGCGSMPRTLRRRCAPPPGPA